MRRFSPYYGPILIGLCAVFLIAQVLVRPAVGLADNGDFSKMAGPFGLGPEDGSWETRDQFGEFIFRFIKADRYNYAREFKRAEFLSSEFFFVKIARGLQRIVRPGPRFDIRWLGSVTGIVFLFAIGIWIYALPERLRFVAGLFVVFIWTDAAYVQYLNSFYMDAAALIFFVLTIAAALHFIKHPESRVFAMLLASAGALFAVSKSQHALPALFLAPLFLAFALWSRDLVVRVTLIGGAVAVVVGALFVMGRITPMWTSNNVYNVVFMHLLPNSEDPQRALEDVGLNRDELRLVGTYSYMSDSPMQNPAWVKAFKDRCNYRTLLRYYVVHPLSTARLVYKHVALAATRIRPWGNLAREDGFKGWAQSTSFTYWSDFRSYLFKRAPWYAFALALLAALGAVVLLWGSPQDRAFAGLILVVQLIAAIECASAVLADGVETERHLFMFHVATEVTILLFAPLILRVWTVLKTPIGTA